MQASPVAAPSPAVRAIPKRTLRMSLTGGTYAKTVDPGAQRPHSKRQIMGFVELDLVNGAYEGNTRYDSKHYKYQLEQIPDGILEMNDFVDWESYTSPDNLNGLGTKEQSSVTVKKTKLLQQLEMETSRKPDMALIYHVQAIVDNYLTRGRHDHTIKYHVLLRFLQDCAPAGMSINNLGFKIIMDYDYKNSNTLTKFKEFRKNART